MILHLSYSSACSCKRGGVTWGMDTGREEFGGHLRILPTIMYDTLVVKFYKFIKHKNS